MGEVEFIRRMFRYDDWANAGHLKAMREGASVPGALKAMAHVLSARAIWLRRIRHEPTDALVFYPELGLDECFERLEQVRRDWDEWLHTLTPAMLNELVSFKDSHGDAYTLDRRTMLTHVLLHGAHHRGQSAQHQKKAGNKLSDMDLYVSPVAQE